MLRKKYFYIILMLIITIGYLLSLPSSGAAELLKGVSYNVRRGDTLWDIAKKYNTTIKDIAAANRLSNPNRIYPGQKLFIPSPNRLYRVEKGDSLWKIAKKLNISYPALRKANPMKKANLIRPGQIINIPYSSGAPPAKPLPLAGKTVVLDPGHGGKDPGAIGPTGVREKDVNLAIAKALQNYLEAQGAKVISTRTGDNFVSLQDRVTLANKSGADIFISIHNNSAINRIAHGTETFSRPGDNAGAQLAREIHANVLKEILLTNRGVKTARFYILRNNQLPSSLIEVAFISNFNEEKLLTSDVFRQKAANGIFQGISTYFLVK